jgi:formate/nitrite transporter FocA (FNT family)
MRSSVITVKSLTVFGGLFALIVVIIVGKELFSTNCVRVELAIAVNTVWKTVRPSPGRLSPLAM